jgi:hypothetical protein
LQLKIFNFKTPMKTALLLTALLGLTACKTTTFTYTRTLVSFGTNIVSSVTARDTRFFMMSDAAVEGGINPSNGVVNIKVAVKSGGDAVMAQAIAQGVAAGMMAGAKSGL